ncbi:hypothetical protein D1BOALGB6SA_3344 [Olavius sp. associated proteobacterium Delta 1]|nr:hypothetical protein D1BOALGB6SA_3344 [Olavius sp. associated proteobacterium Delta 1]
MSLAEYTEPQRVLTKIYLCDLSVLERSPAERDASIGERFLTPAWQSIAS